MSTSALVALASFLAGVAEAPPLAGVDAPAFDGVAPFDAALAGTTGAAFFGVAAAFFGVELLERTEPAIELERELTSRFSTTSRRLRKSIASPVLCTASAMSRSAQEAGALGPNLTFGEDELLKRHKCDQTKQKKSPRAQERERLRLTKT